MINSVFVSQALAKVLISPIRPSVNLSVYPSVCEAFFSVSTVIFLNFFCVTIEAHNWEKVKFGPKVRVCKIEYFVKYLQMLKRYCWKPISIAFNKNWVFETNLTKDGLNGVYLTMNSPINGYFYIKYIETSLQWL